jgi:DNA-binding NarL/FixJ family response regulator
MVQLLDSQPDLEVTAEAEDSNGALDAIRSKAFDLVTLDIRLQRGANGIDLTKMILAENPDLPVLIVSMHDEISDAERALRAGARGYVMKREALDCLLTAVREVLNGGMYMSPALTQRMLLPDGPVGFGSLYYKDCDSLGAVGHVID